MMRSISSTCPLWKEPRTSHSRLGVLYVLDPSSECCVRDRGSIETNERTNDRCQQTCSLPPKPLGVITCRSQRTLGEIFMTTSGSSPQRKLYSAVHSQPDHSHAEQNIVLKCGGAGKHASMLTESVHEMQRRHTLQLTCSGSPQTP